MADPFLTLNGQPGEFLARADVNLLDADSAHFNQGQGVWLQANSTATLIPDPTGTSPFATNVVRIQGALNAGWRMVQLEAPPVTAGVEYAWGTWLFNQGLDPITVRSQLDYSDAAFDFVGSSAPNDTLLQPGVWTFNGFSAVAIPLAESARWFIRTLDAEAGQDYLIASCIQALGSDPTFVPSLNIVGSVDTRSRLAVPDWANAANHVWVVAKSGLVDSGAAYVYRATNTAGLPFFAWYEPGAVAMSAESTIQCPYPAGSFQFVRSTLDHTTGDVTFFDSDDGNAWDIYEVIAGAGATSIQVIADQVQIGQASWYSGGIAAFDIGFMELRDGIDGPVVYRMDAADVLAAL